MEMPDCSLCRGNQAQVKEGATLFPTSRRNFPNHLGKNSNVYLGSAELAAICCKLGRICRCTSGSLSNSAIVAGW